MAKTKKLPLYNPKPKPKRKRKSRASAVTTTKKSRDPKDQSIFDAFIGLVQDQLMCHDLFKQFKEMARSESPDAKRIMKVGKKMKELCKEQRDKFCRALLNIWATLHQRPELF